MATIALYKGKINQMPGLIRNAKREVKGLGTQLDTLKKKCEKVDTGICNIDDVINTISASTKTQEDKITLLENLGTNVEQFAEDTVNIDENVAELINQNKEDFYDQYSYLKPDSEKSFFERAKEKLKKVIEWCKENWKVILAVVVAIAAVVALVFAALSGSVLALLALVGALVNVLGKLIGDTIGFISRGMKDGVWDWGTPLNEYLLELVASTFGGMVGGIMSKFGNAALACGAEGATTSLLEDMLKSLCGLSDTTLLEAFENALISGTIAAALGGLLEKPAAAVNKLLSKIPGLSRLAGKGSFSATYKQVLKKLENGVFKKVSFQTVLNGTISNLSGDFIKNLLDGLGFLDGLEKLFKIGAKTIVPVIPPVGPIVIGPYGI